jgi:hypothetical protein
MTGNMHVRRTGCVLQNYFSGVKKMPNGRSGGSLIQKADLKELINAVPDAAMVGQMFVYSPRIRPVNASEATRFAEQCPDDRVAVEEQDHKAYVIHLADEESKFVWIVIGPESLYFGNSGSDTLSGATSIRAGRDGWRSDL